MLRLSNALSRMAVLPIPRWCTAGVAPGPRALCAMISPRMYDSVKRFEPTCNDT